MEKWKKVKKRGKRAIIAYYTGCINNINDQKH